MHISQSVTSVWAHQWCFHRCSLSLSKDIGGKLLVTYHDLKWPRRHEEGSLVAIFWFRVSILTVNGCLKGFQMIYVQKGAFQYSPIALAYNGEVAKLTWPWVTDIKIPSRYDEHSNFFWGEVTWRPGDLTLIDLTWVWKFHNMCGKNYE